MHPPDPRRSALRAARRQRRLRKQRLKASMARGKQRGNRGVVIVASRNGRAGTRRAVRPSRVGPRDRAGRQGGHVAGMQRRRLLCATVELAYEQGIHAITVATLCERAGLSRRTFYECFPDLQACLLATFDDSMEQAARVVEQAVAPAGEERAKARDKRRSRKWLEQTRAGLTALLGILRQRARYRAPSGRRGARRGPRHARSAQAWYRPNHHIRRSGTLGNEGKP